MLKRKPTDSLCRGGWLLSVFFCTPLWAANWQVTPELGLKTTYSDNINASAATQGEHDWIFQVNPGLKVKADGARLQLSANYQMQNLLYARADQESRIQHQLDARGRAELNPNLLYLDAYANISQQNVSPFASGFQDETSTTLNRTDVTTLGVSPYLRLRLQDHWLSELRYSHNRVSSDAAGLSDAQSNSVLLSVNQNVPGKRASWGASYRYAHTDNSVSSDYAQTMLMLNGRYRLTPKFGLLASLGYEKHDYLALVHSPEGEVVTAGVFWMPNSRGLIDVSVGQRFYGTSYNMNAHYRMRRAEVSASYNEDISTAQSRFFMPLTLVGNNGTNPVTFTENTNILSNRVFLERNFLLSLRLNGVKQSLTLSANRGEREAQNSQTLDSVLLGSLSSATTDHATQLGLGTAWDWQISSRSTSNVTLRYRQDQFHAIHTELEHWSFETSLRHRLQRNLSSVLEFVHQTTSGHTAPNHHNNRVAASLNFTF